MVVTIVGKQYKQFTDKQSGQVKAYSQCFGTYKFGRADSLNGNMCDGEQVISFYPDVSDYDNFVVGCKVLLEYDPKGRLVDYEFIDG